MTDTRAQPSEDEMRAAYEAELNRITSTEMIIQTVVSLVNLGARRLGLAGGPDAPRDLEQVADAIDGAKALMPILERRSPQEMGPLRDALAQLQIAYAKEASAKPASQPPQPSQPRQQDTSRPGPAQASGRLWVPGQ